MLRIELEYSYDGELIHNIIDDSTDELVATVFAGEDVAAQIIDSLDTVNTLGEL